MFKFLFALFLVATVAFAQNADIGLPGFNQTVKAGSDLIVQVQRPNSLTGSEEVAVVIGLRSCYNGPCSSPSEVLGDILYSGSFKPVYHETNLPPYQNFSVQVPRTFAAGTALVGVVHLTLIGAGPSPYLETLNQTVYVV